MGSGAASDVPSRPAPFSLSATSYSDCSFLQEWAWVTSLAGLLGAFLGWTGWPNVFVGTLAAFTLNGIVAAVLILIGHATRKSSTAFGPWMVAGATIGVLWAPRALSL